MTTRKRGAGQASTTPPPNGEPSPRKRQSRTRPTRSTVSPPVEADLTDAPPDPPEYAEGNSTRSTGRLASEVQTGPMRWFIESWIPLHALTFVVGCPGCGKSTFGAWLMSRAKRPAVLPGCEESIETALVPRMSANGVSLSRALILDGRLWSVPYDRAALTAVLTAHRADLLWIDPIDSYVGEADENDGQSVRAALECLAKISADTSCTIVAARHPGKQPANVCPGSRQWRAVPREIVQLTSAEGSPPRRHMVRYKDPAGLGRQPREYTISGSPPEPGIFALGDTLPEGEADVIGIADPVDRWKVDQAIALLGALLAETEQESSYVYAVAEKERLGDRLVRTAARRLGVLVRREGVGREHRSYWSLPTPATPAVSQ